jgi:hypothetical protein
LDIILIQEPVINIVNLTMANPRWSVIYPSTHNKDCTNRTHSVILVNKTLSKDSWCTIPVNSPDITTMEINKTSGQICVYNIYNDITHDKTLTTLKNHFTSENTLRSNAMNGILLMGDLNCHHPMWDEPRNQHLFTAANLRAAQPLLEMLVTYDLVMALPEELPTLVVNSTGNHTRPDNVFCSSHLLDAITACNIQPDHYPIITDIDLNPDRINPQVRKNYRSTDWEEFENSLVTKLNELPPPNEIDSIPQLEQKLEEVTQAILTTIENVVPTSKPSPYTKRWWIPDLDVQNKVIRKLAHTMYAKRQQHSHPIHTQLKTA